MEFSDIQALLFTKKQTTAEESKAEFLSKHEKLTELLEEDIRTAFDTFSFRIDKDLESQISYQLIMLWLDSPLVGRPSS